MNRVRDVGAVRQVPDFQRILHGGEQSPLNYEHSWLSLMAIPRTPHRCFARATADIQQNKTPVIMWLIDAINVGMFLVCIKIKVPDDNGKLRFDSRVDAEFKINIIAQT